MAQPPLTSLPPPPTPQLHRPLSPGEGEEIPLEQSAPSSGTMKKRLSVDLGAIHTPRFTSNYEERKRNQKIAVFCAAFIGILLLVVLVVGVIYNTTYINLLSQAVRRFHPENHNGAMVGRGQAPPAFSAAQHSAGPHSPALPTADDKFPAITVGSEDRPLAQFAMSPFRVFGRPGRPEDGSGSEDSANPLNVVFHGGSDGAHAKFNLGTIGELFPPPAHLDKRDAVEVKEVVVRDPRHVASFVIPLHRREARSTRGAPRVNQVHNDDDLKDFHRRLLKEADDLRRLMENIEEEIHVMEHRDRVNAISPDDITSDGFPAPASLVEEDPHVREERVRRSDGQVLEALRLRRQRLLDEAAKMEQEDAEDAHARRKREVDLAEVVQSMLIPPDQWTHDKRQARSHAIEELLLQREKLLAEAHDIGRMIEALHARERKSSNAPVLKPRARRQVQDAAHDMQTLMRLRKWKRTLPATNLFLESVRKKKQAEPSLMKRLGDMRTSLLREADDIMVIVNELQSDPYVSPVQGPHGQAPQFHGPPPHGSRGSASSALLDVWPSVPPDYTPNTRSNGSAGGGNASNHTVAAQIQATAANLTATGNATGIATAVQPSFGRSANASLPLHPEHAGSNLTAGHHSRYAEEDPGCPPGHRACHDRSGCVMASMWCDGAVHCPDASDEAHCSCRDRVERDRLCDGYFDCPLGEDELGCMGCLPTEFSCDDFSERKRGATCVPRTSRCDGNMDCPSGKDEAECSLLALAVTGRKTLPVSYQSGFLHRNLRGEWYPVCGNGVARDWALQACRDVVSPDIEDVNIDLAPAPPMYRGEWLTLAGEGALSVVTECPTVAVVTCPPMLAGSRVAPPQSPYARARPENFDWSRESDEELADPEDMRTRLKRYLHLAPGLDPVLLDYNQLDEVAADLVREEEAKMRAAASEEDDEDDDDDLTNSRNGKAHRMKETQQDEDDIVQNNSGEDGVAFQLDPQALHRVLGDEASGQRERDAEKVLLRRIPAASSSTARHSVASSPRSYDEPGQEVRLRNPRDTPSPPVLSLANSEAAVPVERPRRGSAAPRVVGGKPAKPGAWPWVVAMYRDGVFHCGGVIVDESWILTAAHCVDGYERHYLEIQAGMLRRFSFSPMEQTRTINFVVKHDKYNPEDMRNDIALVHVAEPLRLNRWVRPIALADWGGEHGPLDPPAGTQCTAVGWGATVEHGPDPDHMREVRVPVLAACVHPEDRRSGGLCAGLYEGGKDACQGDSGGPLLCRMPEDPTRFYAAGVVSHGEGCARPNEPGAYTRVSRFIHWIHDTIRMDHVVNDTPLLHCPGYQCMSGPRRCVAPKKRCDRSVDCLKAEDEMHCDWGLDSFMRAAVGGPPGLVPYNSSSVARAHGAREAEGDEAGAVVFPPTGADPAADPAADPTNTYDQQHTDAAPQPPLPEQGAGSPQPGSAEPAAPESAAPGPVAPEPAAPEPAAPEPAAPEPVAPEPAAPETAAGPEIAAPQPAPAEPDAPSSPAGEAATGAAGNSQPPQFVFLPPEMPAVGPFPVDNSTGAAGAYNPAAAFAARPVANNTTTVNDGALNATATGNGTSGSWPTYQPGAAVANLTAQNGTAGTGSPAAPIYLDAAVNQTATDAVPDLAGAVAAAGNATDAGQPGAEAEVVAPAEATAGPANATLGLDNSAVATEAVGNSTASESGTAMGSPVPQGLGNATFNETNPTVAQGQAPVLASNDTTPGLSTEGPSGGAVGGAVEGAIESTVGGAGQVQGEGVGVGGGVVGGSSAAAMAAAASAMYGANDTFACKRTPQVVAASRRCDRAVDCVDGTDEMECRCADYLRVSRPDALCDGSPDCLDGSDEQGCALCPQGQYRCWQSPGSPCIPHGLECDGALDCPNGEDEAHCLALTDGVSLQVDSSGLPVLQREGVVARKVHGLWRPICDGVHGSARSVSSWAADTCVALGFSGWESVNDTLVEERPLVLSSPRIVPLEGPLQVAGVDKPVNLNLIPGLGGIANGGLCTGIRVRCAPGVDGAPGNFIQIPGAASGSSEGLPEGRGTVQGLRQVYSTAQACSKAPGLAHQGGLFAWPWHAEVLVEGMPSLATGALVTDSWVLASASALGSLDPSRSYVTVLLGGPRSELGVTGPYEQARRVDAIVRVPSTSAVLLRLERPAVLTKHVRSTGLPDWYAMVKKAMSCVAVGRGATGAWETVHLKHLPTCVDGAGYGRTCFTGPECSAESLPVRVPWSGVVACRTLSGWYPAAVYSVADQCGLSGSVAFDAVHFMLRHVRNIIDGDIAVPASPAPACPGLRCPVGQCLPPSSVCNGAVECRGALDESPATCEPRRIACDAGGNSRDCVCRVDEVRCASGVGCVDQRRWCDGVPDCADGSDEPANCTCAAFLARSRPALLCDGRRHCWDRTDEHPDLCTCTPDRFFCRKSGRCVAPEVVCDGYYDCPDGEDETFCYAVESLNPAMVPGSVVHRSFGSWHSYCGAGDVAQAADTACSSVLGLSRARTATAVNATQAVLPEYDSFSEARLNARTGVALRGPGPLVTLRSKQLDANHPCTQTFVTCQ
ncbi:uncharacterized protein LOC117650158 isoform X2 [Thrips palmi]|uniref:Uncharacterized protein LOC117650158 isoform X2 n=1 Tax=Thrips palmi TaxID=161013 RepID=A0A6P8ZVH9_THRPL|nr:uncharacterized protein LOC117650158 isoform X2 [Thrips palmi]